MKINIINGPNLNVKVALSRDVGDGERLYAMLHKDDPADGQYTFDGQNGQDGTNGQDGANAMIDITYEAPGNNCPNVGQRVSYGIDGNNDAALKCVDWKTGEALWSWDGKRVGGVGLGTFIFVGNQILLITEKGNLVVGRVSKKGFALESSTQILGGKCWTAPALANGMLITRNSRGQTVGVRVSSQNN